LALLPAVMGCERRPEQDQFGNLLGPVYSSDKLNRQGLLGIRPGMRLEQAAAILEAQGYSSIARNASERERDRHAIVKPQYFWIAAPPGSEAYDFPQSVKLSYVQRPGGIREVVAIGHLKRISREARADAAGTRRSIIRRYGRPSLWRQDFYRNQLWDEIDYVAAPAWRDQDRIEHLRACHVDWRCEKLLRDFDCRETMRRGRQSSLKISFGQEGNRVYYELSDWRRMYDAQARDGKLEKLDLRGAFCTAPPQGGRPGMVVTVPG
jgi:hypothetical protein